MPRNRKARVMKSEDAVIGRVVKCDEWGGQITPVNLDSRIGRISDITSGRRALGQRKFRVNDQTTPNQRRGAL